MFSYDYRIAAGFDNGLNSTYYNLRWNKLKWWIEESEDDEPMPRMITFGEASKKFPTYEMPTLFKKMEWYVDSYGKQINPLHFSHALVLHHGLNARGSVKGPEARAAIIEGYDKIITGTRAALQERGDTESLRALESLVKKYRGKLKWKRIG